MGGYRETPKYFVASITDVFRRHVLRVAQSLVDDGRLDCPEQVFDLHMDDLDRGLADPGVDLRALAEQNTRFLNRLKRVRSLPRIVDSRGKILRPPTKEAGEGELLGDVVRIVKFCKSRGAKIALDTSGPALREIVRTGAMWLVKPNVEELCTLLDHKIKDTPESLAKAGRKLLDKVDIILISRGRKGSIVVTKEAAWRAKARGRARVFSTVGCGDYLLAGFLKGRMDRSDNARALTTATQIATTKACGWTESRTWQQVKRKVTVEISRV